MAHIVDIHEHRKTIRVFSCNFSTRIVRSNASHASLVQNATMYTRHIPNLKNTSGEKIGGVLLILLQHLNHHMQVEHIMLLQKFVCGQNHCQYLIV